ncbi:phage tail sheath family protein [Akkermansia glycaniphila]|uniref:Phage tail sheath protein n=1 Tax=Akkermansia glycaniphila TaxID=1679444 RepID=A0A1C7PBW0_9BACT|nr:phage tail sheath C-terminal domain-containing protein [Akkermansia glycaniphila]OCA03066.1 phage tail protein [Akkermansia glycaniphila]SEH86343.1 phage tail sheath protein [Akkermansia glycaniphila]
MGEYKTPGVYIVEKSAFPNSVVEAPTAIPAFIGITQKAENGADSLLMKPWKISSMTEYVKYFGEGPSLDFKVDIKTYDPGASRDSEGAITPKDAVMKPDPGIFQQVVEVVETNEKNESVKKGYAFCVTGDNKYTLYRQMLMFFANGGGTCYIVSVGTYGAMLSKESVAGALSALEKEQEITMVVVPEAAYSASCSDMQTQMLNHCVKMQNRFAIFDVQPKSDENEPMALQISKFQTGIGANGLSYGAAYYPWLNTSVLSEIKPGMVELGEGFQTHCRRFFGSDPHLAQAIEQCMAKKITLSVGQSQIINGVLYKYDDSGATPEEKQKKNTIEISPESQTVNRVNLHYLLVKSSPLYQTAMKALKSHLNLLPPSAAMAGLYTMVDQTKGVWKAPANVSVNYVQSPSEIIDNAAQMDLNVPMNGKAINAIRSFIGEGIKVWGARTLDGNSLDWRYINVRRTMLFLEESIKNAARAYVFEANDANTWLNMKCMIENFLRGVWKRGGLAGSVPEDAFSVHVGLGDTMAPEDILEGMLRITVLVAISRPAEFIEITFQQQMQKS